MCRYVKHNAKLKFPGFRGMPNNHITLNLTIETKLDVIPESLDLTAAHSTLQPLKFTALCDKDVTHTYVHQGYKRFYPPATWQVSGTIDPRDYSYIPKLIMGSF